MSMSGSGVEKNALAGSATAGTTAQNALSTVNPIYSRLSTGTVGYTPEQKADMKTSAAQGLGGAVAGATGAGGLYAARTGNAGGAAAAIDDSARAAMQQQSEADLSVENKDADLAAKNRIAGLSGLSDIYSDANRTGVGYLDTANSAATARRNAKYSLLDPITSILGTNKRVQGIGS